MPLRSRDKFALAGVVAGALAIRLIFVFLVRPVPVSDFGWYLAHGLAIAQGRGYSTNGIATAYWPPGWPYFLAAEIVLFGKSLLAVETIQALLNSFTAGLVYLLARKVAGTAAAVAAGTVYACLPSAIEWSAVTGSEPLYTFLWVIVAYIWLNRSLHGLLWMSASGIILGAAALVRPGALLSWIVIAAYLLSIENRKSRGRILVTVLATVVCTSIVIAPTLVRNYRSFHHFVGISTNGGVTFYLANNPRPGRHELGSSHEEEVINALIRDPRTEAEGNRLAGHLALDFAASHPLLEARLFAWEVKELYRADHGAIPFTIGQIQTSRKSVRMMQIAALNDAFYDILMICALVGFIVCCIDRKIGADPGWRILAGLILYNTVLFGAFGGNDRYRYPTMPFFAVFAGVAMAAAVAVRNRRARLVNDPLHVIMERRDAPSVLSK